MLMEGFRLRLVFFIILMYMWKIRHFGIQNQLLI